MCQGKSKDDRGEVVAALYNHKFVKEDGSKGIHNTAYAVQLLMDSI